MGREKPFLFYGGSSDSGSPPHGRGKAEKSGLFYNGRRITPAWAGKRVACWCRCTIPEDHPRMGGEKANGSDAPDDDEGSPPRGRGKVHSVFKVRKHHRITPAWAGKSSRVMVLPSCRMGSPPRRRGKGRLVVNHHPLPGITPAWAGKSPASQPWSPPLWMMVIRPRP